MAAEQQELNGMAKVEMIWDDFAAMRRTTDDDNDDERRLADVVRYMYICMRVYDCLCDTITKQRLVDDVVDADNSNDSDNETVKSHTRTRSSAKATTILYNWDLNY